VSKLKNILFYVTTIVAFVLLIFFVVNEGKEQESGKVISYKPSVEASTWDQFSETWSNNLSHPLAILLLQIITIIFVARIFGFICRKIKQPTVIGEIVAGIFLGPSFIGWFYPEFSAFIFPPASLSNLQFLSQIGLILFMFIVGMELDLNILKNKAREAIIISHASIVIPFALGVGLAYFIYEEYAPQNINFLSFALFTGIATSITAFPVLARIVQEKGLSKTKLGNIAITCAAADDITAWCILAAVIAIVKAGSVMSAFYIILLALLYVFSMLKVVKPFLNKIGEKYSNKEGLSKPVVAVFFMTLLLSSYLTEVIGIHALFGAFLAGVIMPPNANFRSIFIEKIEDLSLILLLPLFFVFTGLRTQIGLLDNWSLWQTCFLIIIVAVAGKFLGSALAAKFVGQTWRESMIIGALMNTRGLMELVVLNIGYDLGVLSPEIFAMMVIMALVTTIMTAPALLLINRLSGRKKVDISKASKPDKYNILVSFGSPYKGVSLIRLANSFVKRSIANSKVTAIHLSPSNEINQFNLHEYERDSFRPVKFEAKKLGLPINIYFKPSQDIESEIIETANQGDFDLLIIGIGNSVYEGTVLGRMFGFMKRITSPRRVVESIVGKEKLFKAAIFDDTVNNIIRESKVPVGILIDKKLEKLNEVFMPFLTVSDVFLLEYAQKLIHNSQSRISIMDPEGIIGSHPDIQQTIETLKQVAPDHIEILESRKVDPEILDETDLVLISIESWRKAVESRIKWIADAPSVLIIKNQ
jgi:Kef-type K+ transport system membrane component KefB